MKPELWACAKAVFAKRHSAADYESFLSAIKHGMANLPIFRMARDVVLVDPEPAVETRARQVSTVTAVLRSRQRSLAPYIKSLRPHQWVKNLLLFVPLGLAHKVLDVQALLSVGLGFLAFGLCASGIYVFNDLLDLNEDRRHPRKRLRPFASGELPIAHGVAMVPALLLASLALALLLPLAFLGVLLTYGASALSYSLYLKRTMLFDVITLAGLYTTRIIAGSAALAIPYSVWLLAFSMFVFFSLALVKRYVELTHQAESTTRKASGRAYRSEDRETLAQFGIASGMLGVLVLALYIDSSVVKTLYRRPEVLWFVCPLMLYLVCRVWILARRNQLHDDPIVFAIYDRRSQLMLVAIGVLLLAATL